MRKKSVTQHVNYWATWVVIWKNRHKLVLLKVSKYLFSSLEKWFVFVCCHKIGNIQINSPIFLYLPKISFPKSFLRAKMWTLNVLFISLITASLAYFDTFFIFVCRNNLSGAFSQFTVQTNKQQGTFHNLFFFFNYPIETEYWMLHLVQKSLRTSHYLIW